MTSTAARPSPAGTTRRAPDRAVLAVACLGQFMVVLDVSIVNVALPSIRADLGFDEAGLQWVVNAYTIAFAGFLLLGGRAADLFGQRRMFLVGLGLFGLASLVGGLAQDEVTLVAARAVQGLGGAVLAPATLTILTTTFPEGPPRARALGVWSAVAGAGGAVGALVGGVLTELLDWRWILFVNVPVAVVGVVAARALLVDGSRGDRRGGADGLDVTGAVLVTAGLVALVLGIVDGEAYGWSAPATLGPLVAGLALLAWFVLHEGRVARRPLLPLRLFRLPAVAAANAVMFFLGAAVFGSWYFLSLCLQNVLGYSPLETGLAFLPQTLAIILGAQLSSRLVSRTGARPLLVVGGVVTAVGLGWLSRLSADSTYLGDLAVPSVLVTLGIGLAFTPVALTATAGVDRADAGLASGLVNTTRQVGGSLGLAVLATLAAGRTAERLPAGADAGAGTARPGEEVQVALVAGYGLAFGVAAAFALAAALLAFAVRVPDRVPDPARP